MDILGMSVSASAVILLIIALRKIFPSAVAGRTAKLLWLTAAVRLLIPFAYPDPVTISVTRTVNESAYADVATQTYEVPGAYFGVPIRLDIPGFVNYVWLFGAVFTLALFLFKHINTRRIFSCALPFEYDTAPLLAEYRIRRWVTVSVSDMTDVPFTYGVIFPRIILPRSLLAADGTQLRNILCHELGHIKSCDVIYKSVLVLCAAVHWFNPLVWAMLVLADRDIELSCDRTAISRGKCTPEEYALTLINMEERRGGLCETGFTGGSLKERVVRVMTGKRGKSFAPAVFAAILTLSAAVCVNFYSDPYHGSETVTEAVYADELFVVSDSMGAIEVSSVAEDVVIEDTAITYTAEDTAIEYAYAEYRKTQTGCKEHIRQHLTPN